MVSGCYGHSCGELFRALLAVAVAWEERLAEKSFYFGGAIHLPHDFADYQCVSDANVAGGTNLMPPGTPTKGNTLIFYVLAIPAVEGELHEGLSRQCEAVRVGFEGRSCLST